METLKRKIQRVVKAYVAIVPYDLHWPPIFVTESSVPIAHPGGPPASDLAVNQPHLDPARMEGGRCQDILHDPNGAFAGSLVLFQNDLDALSRSNGAALSAVHTDEEFSL